MRRLLGCVYRRSVLLTLLAVILLLYLIFGTGRVTNQGNHHIDMLIPDGPVLVMPAEHTHQGQNEKLETSKTESAGSNLNNEPEPKQQVGHNTEVTTRDVESRCKTFNNSIYEKHRAYKYEFLSHIIVNDTYRLMYCYIPKVANTNFRRVFLGINGVVDKSKVFNVSGYDIYVTYEGTFEYLKDTKPADRLQKLKHYQKFFFVREPLERLVSGFHSKFRHPNPANRKMFYKAVEVFYKKNPKLPFASSVLKNVSKGDIQFSDFVIYITDLFESGGLINEHFTPSHHLCRPCEVHYDYIGKYDSLENDAAYVFDKLNVGFKFPPKNDNYTHHSSSHYVKDYYQELHPDLLKKLWKMFEVDFYLFGYDLPAWYKSKLQ